MNQFQKLLSPKLSKINGYKTTYLSNFNRRRYSRRMARDYSNFWSCLSKNLESIVKSGYLFSEIL
jgi:uridine kinase